MSIWSLLGIILLAGAIGGMANSLISKQGFQLPQVVKSNGTNIFVPGFVGNLLIGAIASGVSWSLYGPLSQAVLGRDTITMALATIGGAVLTGMIGAGWLSNASSQSVMRAAAVNAASASPSLEAAQQIATASPLDALKVAQQISSTSGGLSKDTPAIANSGL